MNEAAGKSVKEHKVADDILDRLSSLANVTEELSQKVDVKLNRICRSPSPTCGDEKSKPVDYPTYFAELEERIDSIYNSVYKIKDIMDRVEV